MSQTIDLGKVVPQKGVDYWTPEEESAMTQAKRDALNAASAANAAKTNTEKATADAKVATKAANDAAQSVDDSKAQAVAAAKEANNAATNANQAAANGNTQYNTLKNYHDTVTVPDHQTAVADHNTASSDHTRANTDHNTATSDHTNVTTNWRKEFTDAQAARQTEFNRTQAEKQTEFERTQAEKQAVFDADHERAENDHTSLAGGIAVELNKHVGMYDKNVSKALSSNVATNRILTTLPSGEVTQVTKTGWNISRINAEELTFGDTAFLKMLSAGGQNLMVEGAVLFASEEEIKDKDGNVIATRLTSLFRASNTDIPESGFVVKTLSLKGKNLLVSHPAEITELVMGRSGVGASMATLEGNLQNEIDEKANLSGFHGAMITGGAISVVPEKADDAMPAYTENLPAARMVGDGGKLTDQTFAQGVYPHYPHVPDDAKGKRSSLSFERVEGECLGCNQMFNEPVADRRVGNVSLTMTSDRLLKFKGTANASEAQTMATVKSIPIGHKVLNIAHTTKQSGSSFTYYTDNKYGQRIIVSSAPVGFNLYTLEGGNLCVLSAENGRTYDWEGYFFNLDLTLLFPTPSGQTFVSKLTSNESSALAVCNKLGYASVITYDE